MTILLQQNPVATRGHPRSPQSPFRDTVLVQKQYLTKSPLSSPRSPQQQLQRELNTPTSTTPTATPMIGMRLMQPTTMRVPEHFATPNITTPPVEEDDAKSDVSSLQCGTCPPNPHFDPTNDPLAPGNRMCDPPFEITVRIKTKIVEELVKPEWLESAAEAKARKKAEKMAKKLAKQHAKEKSGGRHRRSKSMFSMGTEQRDDAMKPDLIQRSFSEESAPTAVLKNGKGHQRTASSPVFDQIVVGPGGQPMFAHQAEAEAENDVPSLSSLKELKDVNYDDFKPHLDSAGDCIDPATSFTDSYQTNSTLYESSGEQQPQQESPSPRKGMVRREFQRRFLFFKKKNATPMEHLETELSKTSSRDKTGKTVNSSLADWKQSSSSCMV